MKEALSLGDTARDIITGFEGVVTGLMFYIGGHHQILVSPRGLTKDGDPMPAQWFDAPRLTKAGTPPEGAAALLN
jgi:hypothetical protein